MAKKKLKAQQIDINEVLSNVEEYNYSIKDLNKDDLVPNVIDNIIIFKNSDGKPEMHLPVEMGGISYKNWKNDRGGIFYKDLKVNEGNYILLQGEGKRYIARLIEEKEVEKFNMLNLIDGKIKDKPYMILKKLHENENLTTTNRTIVYDDSEDIDHDPKIIVSNNLREDEVDTISLFDD